MHQAFPIKPSPKVNSLDFTPWYNAVHASMGFDAAEGPLPELNDDFARLVDQAMPYFDKLARYAQ